MSLPFSPLIRWVELTCAGGGFSSSIVYTILDELVGIVFDERL